MTKSTAVATVVDRTKFIGGSDIASLLGCAPDTWECHTPVALWKRKTAPQAEGPTTGVKKRGKRWEAVVAEMLVETLEAAGNKVEIVRSNTYYTDPDVPHFRCEIDFEVRLNGEEEITNVELKTVHPILDRKWGESGTDDAPVYYLAQGQWGLGVTRRRRCIIAPLFGADELRVFPIEAVPVTINAIRERANTFWQENVLGNVPPVAIELSDLDHIYPAETDAPAVVADDELTRMLLRMRAVDREMKARTAEYEVLEFEVKKAMGNAAELLIPSDGEYKTATTWKVQNRPVLDQAALKEAHPKIHKEFTRKTTPRVFLLKPFAWKGE